MEVHFIKEDLPFNVNKLINIYMCLWHRMCGFCALMLLCAAVRCAAEGQRRRSMQSKYANATGGAAGGGAQTGGSMRRVNTGVLARINP